MHLTKKERRLMKTAPSLNMTQRVSVNPVFAPLDRYAEPDQTGKGQFKGKCNVTRSARAVRTFSGGTARCVPSTTPAARWRSAATTNTAARRSRFSRTLRAPTLLRQLTVGMIESVA